MTGRVKWSRASNRERMHRQGVEFKGRTFVGDQPPKAQRKMIAHYRMLRFLRWGRWRSAKSTIRTFWNLYVGGRSLER